MTDQIPDNHQEKIEANSEAAQKLLDRVGDSPVINDQENRINEDLKKNGVLNPDEKIMVLTKHLAGTQILLALRRYIPQYLGTKSFSLIC